MSKKIEVVGIYKIVDRLYRERSRRFRMRKEVRKEVKEELEESLESIELKKE